MESGVPENLRSFILEMMIFAGDGYFYRCPVVVHYDKSMNPYRGEIRDKEDNELAVVLML